MAKPSVTFIIDHLRTGGAQVHLARLLDGLRGLGYDRLEVINLAGEEELGERILSSGASLRGLRMKSVRTPCFFVDFLRLARHLRNTGPEIVVTYLDTANVAGVLAARLSGVAGVITSRRDLGVFRSGRIQRAAAALSRSADRVVCVCHAVAEETKRREGLPEEKLMVIYNGLKMEQERPVHPTPPRLLFGTVAVADRREKGHEELLRAFPMVLEQRPDARLKLIGGGPLLPELKELAKALGVEEAVCFVGTSHRVPLELAGVTVFVLPSRSEGISNALLEAMALGIPAVATGVGGTPEVVVPGGTGLLVEPGDPRALAAGMLEIVADPVRLTAMGDAARRRVEEFFSHRAMIERFDSLFASVSGRKRP